MPADPDLVSRRSPVPPSGTVAFLFSDIEGSTARWEAGRDAMQSAVHRHDTLMRSAIEAHRGYVFKTVGDAFCATFARARDALEAALYAQRTLAAVDWSAVKGLRVRMAIHVGDADERSGDYFGPAVNRVARLLATGHGGQVLLSAIAAELIEGTLEPEIALRPLGVFRLKDLTTPERVYQLIAPGLQSEFKALRSLDAVPNNLPRQSTSFIGRGDDIDCIKELQRSAPLVTIAGTGGVGKTRLALQVAAELLDDMDGGAWFVNLAPVADPAIVAGTIAAVLGVSQHVDRPPLDALLDYLKDRRLLLVFDNCEHVVAEAARIAAAILECASQVTILATSREALNVGGERVYRVSPLPDRESLRLFVERAQTASPGFSLDDSNDAKVAEICGHLDGIALAIELAASRLRTHSLDDLSRRIEERFRVLRGGDRAAQPRHQTLWALIDWSYELLDDTDRSFFRHLAVFTGGFTLAAAAAVCENDALDEWAALDLLSSLVDKSLVVADAGEAPHRYHLLESIQRYARERVDKSGESRWLSQCHAEFFSGLAGAAYAEWDIAPGPGWLAALRPELDNFRSALAATLERDRDGALGAQMAADVVPIFMRLSLLREAIGWCEKALESRPTVDRAIEARLRYGLSMLYNNQMDLRKALENVERSVALYRQTNDARGLTRALSQLAQQYGRQARYGEAAALAIEALARARETGDRRLLAATLQRCAFSLGADDIETARAQFAESVALFRDLGRDDETGRALLWWADSESVAGCFARAIDLSNEALQIVGPAEKPFVLSNAAGYGLALGDYERAAGIVREAFALAAGISHPILTSLAIAYLAVLANRSDPLGAARLFGYARARLGELDWQPVASDARIQDDLVDSLRRSLDERELQACFAEGAGWPEEQALAQAAAV
ncbi:MAG TPA: adenylate/guanylate cyclase domain-containing protein [Candidatus Baltobacteraceae bacterium]